jgi:conjugative relaxase-like TrwC/TraI family protein
MLTPKPQLNLANAKGYFREHLAVGDYYMDGNLVLGQWRGTGAALLGLDGPVKEGQFLAMCEGLHPETGQRLTMRHNTTRREGDSTVSNRRVFYDFTISPPKSVSLVALYQDARIIEVHDKAVEVMVDELEKFAEARVRKGGAYGDRVTGNVVAATFRHDTSRELDPHLHTHCIVLNATYDWDEEKWKAIHATGMYRAQKFGENLYYHELCKGLKKLGYEIENNGRDFEIRHVPASAIALFSKRHRQIDEETKRRIEAEGLKGNEKALRGQVAHDKRRRKIKSMSAERLRPRWAAEMNESEHSALASIKSGKLPPPLPETSPDLGQYLAWADAHVFERRAVSSDYELISHALAYGRGQNFELKELETMLSGMEYYRDAGSRKLTSPEVLERELEIMNATVEGRYQYRPFCENFTPSDTLGDDQKTAATGILWSKDFITVFKGGAGTGKSYTLREVVRALREEGHPVVIAAVQHQQAADLTKDGLPASTLAQVLASKSVAANAVIIVDEAGQIGGKDMLEIIRLAQSKNARLILSGDTRQQGAVAASDGLRVIEERGRVTPIKLDVVRRQDPRLGTTKTEKAAIREYRSAVELAADGDLKSSFDKLHALGWVREMDVKEIRATLEKEYCQALERKESVLAIGQTWEEVMAANEAIREHLKNEGKLDRGVPVVSWQSKGLTEAQKRDARFYTPGSGGDGVYFIRGYGRYERGDYCRIVSANADGLTLLKDGRKSTIGYEYANRLVVTKNRELELSRGDRLQLKFNGKSSDGQPVRNGELVAVNRVLKDGRIVVRGDDGMKKTLGAKQRMFVPGYAVTAYASQGKTVDTVLATYCGEHMTVNKNQWYVGISRGRKKALVLTDDKEALKLGIEHESGRELALSINPENSPSLSRKQLRMAEKCRQVMTLQSQRTHVAPAVPQVQVKQQQQTTRGIRIWH